MTQPVPLCCTDQQSGEVSPCIHFHVRRTYSGRPSSSMRFSEASPRARRLGKSKAVAGRQGRSGFAGALVGQPGPPVLIYLLLPGAAARTVRATLLAFFALSYGVTLVSHAATIGIPAPTWLA